MILSKMKNINSRCVWATLILLNSHSIVAQTEQPEAICPEGIPVTADSASLLELTNGEILHIKSNLIFMRCSLGQNWDGGSCAGEPTAYNWQQALSVSIQTTYNNSSNWRLPNLKELSVISERACVRPSIDDAMFPNTSPDDYWTSTPSILNDEAAWSVAFTNASNTQRLKTGSLFVRLVRTKLPGE